MLETLNGYECISVYQFAVNVIAKEHKDKFPQLKIIGVVVQRLTFQEERMAALE